MQKKSEIVVIGGGPCGSYSAYTAAKLGSQVTVFEEHEKIGAPNHCAGHLNISSLERFEIKIPEKIIENRIKGAIFYSPSGKKFGLKCEKPVTYVVNRQLFDTHLSKLAIQEGVEYHLKNRVKSLLIKSGYIKGVVLNQTQKVKTNLVIDAEGCSSTILKKIGLQGIKSSLIVRGIQAEIDQMEDQKKDMVEVYLGKKFAPNFFAWIIPKKEGKGKIGLATSTGNPYKYLQKFISKHPIASKKLKESKLTKFVIHPIPISGKIPQIYSNGFLAVGDAASQVKPTTGGGVIFGLTCAKQAGKIAHYAVKTNNYSESNLSRYQHRCNQLIGFDLYIMHRIRQMLNKLSDKKTDNCIAFCKKMQLDKILQKYGDLDFQGKSLLPMIKYPGTLATISYFLYSYLTSLKNQ